MWDYRLCSYKIGEETFFCIKEVFYDTNKNPYTYSAKTKILEWESDDSDTMKDDLLLILEAFNKPILNLENI